MLKNIFLFILIFFVLYILSIFKAPDLASSIEQSLGIQWFNAFVINFKETFDDIVTNFPTQDELKNAYETAQSWALEFKDNFENWLNITKDKIDTIRETLSWAEDTISDIKENIDAAKDFYDANSWTIDDIKNTIDTISEISQEITNTWTNN